MKQTQTFFRVLKFDDRIWEFSLKLENTRDNKYSIYSFIMGYNKNVLGKDKERTEKIIYSDQIDHFCKKYYLNHSNLIRCGIEKPIASWCNMFHEYISGKIESKYKAIDSIIEDKNKKYVIGFDSVKIQVNNNFMII